MKFNLLLSLVFTLEIISIAILIYSITCLYAPFIINIFIGKFNQVNFQPMKVSFNINAGSSIIVNKIHEFPTTQTIEVSDNEGILLIKNNKIKVNQDINNCFIFNDNYYKEAYGLLTIIHNQFEKDTWFILICILLILFLMFTKISLITKLIKDLINDFPSKPFFTRFYQYNYVIYTLSILIINMKIFDLFNNLTARDCFGFKENSILSFTYMRKLTNYSSSENYLGNIKNLIYSSKQLANQYPNPFLFFSENEFLQEDSISYIPILTFFCGIIWISATLGVYDSERDTNQLNIFFKILSFLMWGFSMSLSFAIFVDYFQLYSRYVFYSINNIFSIDVFINLIAMVIIVIAHIIVLIISIRNYKKEKYNITVNIAVKDGEKKIFIDQTVASIHKDDHDTINQATQ